MSWSFGCVTWVATEWRAVLQLEISRGTRVAFQPIETQEHEKSEHFWHDSCRQIAGRRRGVLLGSRI